MEEKFKKAGEETSKRKDHKLTITPAIVPALRHEIEKALEKLGYNVWAGGTCTDMSSCDISFRIK